MTGPGPGVRLHAPSKSTQLDALYYNNKIIQTSPPPFGDKLWPVPLGVRLHAPLKTTHQDALYYNNKIIQTYPPPPRDK